MKKFYGLLTILISGLIISSSAFADDMKKTSIFAAASTTNAVTDVAAIFEKKENCKIVTSFASSSTLAKQIDQGAPADIYLSANPKWMNFLDKKKMTEPGTRFDLLGNRIVLIAPLDSSIKVKIDKGFDPGKILGNEKLAMGDPDHVPAGIYGKQALVSLGAWHGVKAKVARSKDVRAALALVERGEAPLGIVYATDAAISKKVKVVGIFPEDSHPSITYPVALISGKASPVSKAFIKFLKSEDAKAVFEKYGFTVK